MILVRNKSNHPLNMVQSGSIVSLFDPTIQHYDNWGWFQPNKYVARMILVSTIESVGYSIIFIILHRRYEEVQLPATGVRTRKEGRSYSTIWRTIFFTSSRWTRTEWEW
jgi:hypothetical protein